MELQIRRQTCPNTDFCSQTTRELIKQRNGSRSLCAPSSSSVCHLCGFVPWSRPHFLKIHRSCCSLGCSPGGDLLSLGNILCLLVAISFLVIVLFVPSCSSSLLSCCSPLLSSLLSVQFCFLWCPVSLLWLQFIPFGLFYFLAHR